jgi:hypothetical protein
MDQIKSGQSKNYADEGSDGIGGVHVVGERFVKGRGESSKLEQCRHREQLRIS